jgi:hypothetical protein
MTRESGAATPRARARVPTSPSGGFTLRHDERHRDRRPLHRRRPRRLGSPTGARLSRRVPVHPRRPADDVPRPAVDDAPVRRLRHGRRDQPPLPLPARAGPDRAVGRLRPADPDGLRPRRAEAAGEVGRVGVPISSIDDMEILLDGLPLGEVTTSMTINATAAILLAFYVAVADRAGRRSASGWAARSRTTSSRSTSRAARTSTRPRLDAPGDRHLRVLRARAAALEHDLDQRLPHARGRRDGGPGARLHARRRDRLRRGGPLARARRRRFAGRLSFFFAAWSELFEEVAKFRAARRMWARIMRDRFGAREPRSMMCRFHVQTAGSSLTAQSVDNNVVRTTIQALSAVLGGAQSLHTNARDEALALPTEEAARLALRTQQIIAHEAGVTETPDPLAGSYFVETLTNQLEAAARSTSTRSRRWAARWPPSRPATSSARSRRRPTASSARSRPRSGRRRRQPLPRRPRAVARAPAHRPGRRARAGRARPPVRAERDEPRWAARWSGSSGRRGRRQPAAADHRRGQGPPRWARSATACAWRGASTAS